VKENTFFFLSSFIFDKERLNLGLLPGEEKSGATIDSILSYF
jgi:hypothetical protein